MPLRRRCMSGVPAVVGGAILLAGCHAAEKPSSAPAGASGRVQIARPTAQGNGVGLKTEEVQIPPNEDPIKGAITALLSVAGDAQNPGALPKGTRLLSLKVEDGVATIDFSKEFNALADGGDTQESLAQNALRKTLAQFPEVKTMRILVEGKTFESEHADWSEPIPVRDADAGASR